jgi:hypothetical protein
LRYKLLAAGVLLTLLALGSEERLGVSRFANVAPRNQAAIAGPWVQGAGGAFDKLIADAVLNGVKNAEQTLESKKPALNTLTGEAASIATELAEEVANELADARDELNRGRTFAALENAMEASRDLDELKKMFERR